eukprot:TRINITY_DN630_c0_g1_i1.p1 TRINITY_DN630_c0_g1~~TRINITY_DN630_c0_g1_i1.p1  ORF type:complete len:475 (-),score=85.83 TRINITY_DN630_c0_g1_i1:881-2305(-)
MSSTLLEKARALHADIDISERLAVDKLKNPPPTHRDKIYEQHRVKQLVGSILECGERLNEIYDDKQGVRKAEIAGMAGMSALSIFYDRLKDIKELHKRSGVEEFVTESMPVESEAPVMFSGPEGYGRYLALETFHLKSMNLSQFDRSLDYLNYLRTFYKFDHIHSSSKSPAYKAYLSELFDYLRDFLQRVQPLLDVPAELARSEEEFESKYPRGEIPGWPAQEVSVEQNPLFCQACQRLFAKDTVFRAHLSGAKHQTAEKKRKQFESGTSAEARLRHDTARLEHLINNLREILSDTLESTISYVQKKQASTYEERLADIEDMENEQAPIFHDEIDDDDAAAGSDDEEKPLYNPKNLPLGWDGKPIPYWLWKLHGLGVEFRCEICGNQSYWGQRNFDRHFQEWRHQHGMKCLKIPNSRQFQDITKIEDAYALFEKLKREGQMKEWNPDKNEEVEDQDGNVYSKKMYTDLKRQGLL